MAAFLQRQREEEGKAARVKSARNRDWQNGYDESDLECEAWEQAAAHLLDEGREIFGSEAAAQMQFQIHGENPPALPVARKGKGGRLLRRPQRAHPDATVVDFLTAVLRDAGQHGRLSELQDIAARVASRLGWRPGHYRNIGAGSRFDGCKPPYSKRFAEDGTTGWQRCERSRN
uniref:hypothetical protein n=1 Tax=Paracoccus sp. TaxID=267 RepID=UPI001F47D17A|nr:hypothetical protein [Paracoccus sp. (in: a-proteobacteria)]